MLFHQVNANTYTKPRVCYKQSTKLLYSLNFNFDNLFWFNRLSKYLIRRLRRKLFLRAVVVWNTIHRLGWSRLLHCNETTYTKVFTHELIRYIINHRWTPDCPSSNYILPYRAWSFESITATLAANRGSGIGAESITLQLKQLQ